MMIVMTALKIESSAVAVVVAAAAGLDCSSVLFFL